MPGGERRQGRRPRRRAARQDARSARRTFCREQVLTLADFTRTIALMETTRQVESDLAETLRALAGPEGGSAAARRLKLAEDAVRGAQAALSNRERLLEQARGWAEHGGVAALHQAVRAVAEKELAKIKDQLASR